MYTHDAKRMLQMAHQRYELLGTEQWKHSEKWDKYCSVCKAKKELERRIQVPTN
jgi:hypothetical protein